jgi:hypothetical protein
MEAMMRRILGVSVLALAGFYGPSAQAQEAAHPNYFEKPMPAPHQAFEVNVTTAYNQGWGNLTDTQSLLGRSFGRQVQDVAGAGLQFELDLGYRVSPMFALSAYGTLAQYHNATDVSGTNPRSVTAGIQGHWYMRPYRAFCPWATLGTGWRGYWVVPETAPTVTRLGWQVVRVQVGTDFRLARNIALAPYVAGDLNLVFGERLSNGDFRSLDGPPVYATFTAGVLGRFDFANTYVTQSGAVARR